MRLFKCATCGQSIHFDNRFCVKCGSRLAFVPDMVSMQALQPIGEPLWSVVSSPNRQVRFCANEVHDICNWAVPADQEGEFCAVCKHNRLVPDASTPVGLERWRLIGQAQRHLFYSLIRLRLPTPDRLEDPEGGLVFDFLVDEVTPDGSVIPAMTGHEDGLIAIRAAEADDATREQVRSNMNEPYRTMLGHFRHETGHFIWDKLVRDANRLEAFRAMFGDESQDYAEALERNYQSGPPEGWQENYISTYAASHPWEDFAECFAHYLHIIDTLETAGSFGMAIEPEGHKEMAVEVEFDPYNAHSAEQLISVWVPLSVALNSIHRSMGQGDLYPFVVTPVVTAKLQFIHELVHGGVATDQARLAG